MWEGTHTKIDVLSSFPTLERNLTVILDGYTMKCMSKTVWTKVYLRAYCGWTTIKDVWIGHMPTPWRGVSRSKESDDWSFFLSESLLGLWGKVAINKKWAGEVKWTDIISLCRWSFIHVMLFLGEGVIRSLIKSESHLLYILWFSRFFLCY